MDCPSWGLVYCSRMVTFEAQKQVVQRSFTKYHGTGNDFILVDNRSGEWKPTSLEVKALCDRHFGVGADGLILIEPDPNTDFYMNYYNSDGSQSFCGNGSRCAVRFAHSLGMVKKRLTFCAIDGQHSAWIEDDLVRVSMRDTGKVRQMEQWPDTYFLDTGSPHVVQYVQQVEAIDLKKEGAAIRYHEAFAPEGSNVNFVQRTPAGLKVRTYERGVEDETLSCGTGVTAVALVDAFLHGGQQRIIQSKGGLLEVFFADAPTGFTEIFLSAPATRVFEGSIELQLP